MALMERTGEERKRLHLTAPSPVGGVTKSPGLKSCHLFFADCHICLPHIGAELTQQGTGPSLSALKATETPTMYQENSTTILAVKHFGPVSQGLEAKAK